MNLAAEAGLLNGGLPEVCYPSSVVGLTVEPNGIAKSQSPVTEFIADEEAASVCPLLSPSPPTEFEHPLALPSAMGYDHQISPSSTDPELSALPTVNGNAIPNLENVDSHSTGGPPEVFNPTSSVQSMIESSSSSGSSVLHESAACAQLLSNHHYQHLSKASDGDPFTLQENGGKPVLTGIQLAVRKSTEDHCFLDWNWPLIRKISFWTLVSLLMACMCVVVGMVAQLPSRCDPPHAWWQGTLFYEIFPASFQDQNSDGIGDLIGLSNRADYLESLGVRAVRLNSIFVSDHYPDHFDRVKNLMKLDHHLGSLRDFQKTVKNLHGRNISVVLDLPLHLFIEQLGEAGDELTSLPRRDNRVLNNEDYIESPDINDKSEILPTPDLDTVTEPSQKEEGVPQNMVSEALEFWLNQEVDGFYLKGLEHLTYHPRFASYVREWRKVIDKYSQGMHNQKILMCNLDVINSLHLEDDLEKTNAILNHMDLIDVHLDLYSNGTEGIKRSVNSLLGGLLYEKPGYPWIHWNVGSLETRRLAAASGSAEGNLVAVLFNMMLPGTPSIFYGDEIGLKDYFVPEGEHRDAHPPQLAPMHWNTNEQSFGFTSSGIFPWIYPSGSLGSVLHSRKDIIHSVAMFRESSPSIYMNGIVKEGMKTPNCEIRVLDSDIVVIQRWYPRRHSYVMVTNLGDQTLTRDLSSWLYGGEIVVDQRSRTGQYVKFDSLTLNARESLIVKLDK